MAVRRVLAMLLAGVGTTALMALVFGNQWFGDLANGDGTASEDSLVRDLARWLHFPAWVVGRGPVLDQVGIDVSLLVLLGLLAVLILAGARSLEPRRGAFGALVLGWWAALVAAAITGLVRGTLLVVVGDFPSSLMRNVMLNHMAQGLFWGMVYGWLPALACLVAFLATRDARNPSSAPPWASPAPAAGGSLPPNHPAAKPYAPPPGQPAPQGWAPPPPSPGAGPTGGLPVPQLPPAGYAPPVAHTPDAPAAIAAAQPSQPAAWTHTDQDPGPAGEQARTDQDAGPGTDRPRVGQEAEPAEDRGRIGRDAEPPADFTRADFEAELPADWTRTDSGGERLPDDRDDLPADDVPASGGSGEPGGPGGPGGPGESGGSDASEEPPDRPLVPPA
ncbi:hypothetical protein [Thermomonospora cellulosilytica]|uniref:Uncharacterized protein n=1 Tax=Thermomonospora cellulosilytica TaxID=1411118 RepID=A0A7W3R8U8_9ACTN|nr:hypothetical protein [Thermomonospora cellulosilytica]MBA9004111.1 hypothetical protein [Thermomonospora cellulosilytica]